MKTYCDSSLYSISDIEEKNQFQLSLRLLLTINGFIQKESLCLICHQFYIHTEDASSVEEQKIRCSECNKPSHSACTITLFLPPGFYWRCSDCDSDTREQNKPLFSCVQRLKEAFSIGSKYTEVKSEPLVNPEDSEAVNSNDNHWDHEKVDNEFVCIPQRGYYCDLCQFSTFDYQAFRAHITSEEAKIQSVQEAISTCNDIKSNEKTCIKCGLTCQNWNDLFQHVTTYHSRPLDFPHFGDVEWKFLMSHQGTLKRSCCYCGQQFEATEDWITHMKINIEEDCFKVEADNSVDFQPKRSKRFLCAFCPFDGESVKVLNQHIQLEHEGNFNKCLECDFETWAHSVLRRHVNVKHRKIKIKSTLAKKSGNEDAAYFTCCFCPFSTTSKKTFHDHFEQDHEGNRTQCLECDFKAPVVSHLRRHIGNVSLLPLDIIWGFGSHKIPITCRKKPHQEKDQQFFVKSHHLVI